MAESEIILIDKPKGITSFDVIRILRRKMGIRKMGHSGTLDPLATGLLIIGVGEGTKKLSKLVGLPKTYEAEILFGIKTDTGDVTGKTIEEKDASNLDTETVKKALDDIIGFHNLPVPAYSAIKKNGKPLYAYARQGNKIEPPLKKMEVKNARLIKLDGKNLHVYFDVSSGTYIRTLAEFLAERLGTVGTIKNLRRLSIGPYSVSDAESI